MKALFAEILNANQNPCLQHPSWIDQRYNKALKVLC